MLRLWGGWVEFLRSDAKETQGTSVPLLLVLFLFGFVLIWFCVSTALTSGLGASLTSQPC